MMNVGEKVEFNCSFASVEELYNCIEKSNILNLNKVISFENCNGTGKHKFFEGFIGNNTHIFICPLVYNFETSIKFAFIFSRECKPKYLIFLSSFYSLKTTNLIAKYQSEYNLDHPIIYGKINF